MTVSQEIESIALKPLQVCELRRAGTQWEIWSEKYSGSASELQSLGLLENFYGSPDVYRITDSGREYRWTG